MINIISFSGIDIASHTCQGGSILEQLGRFTLLFEEVPHPERAPFENAVCSVPLIRQEKAVPPHLEKYGKKYGTGKRLFVLLLSFLLTAGASPARAVDGGSLGLAHNASGSQGTCSKCHIPHGGQGENIWARDLTATADFGGIHQLCDSCHNPAVSIGISGGGTVFTSGAYMNHVMHDWADVSGGEAVIPATGDFPLDLTDTDNVPFLGSNPEAQPTASEGFYCGSCHNPHMQPNWGTPVDDGNGDYLRVDTTVVTSMADFGGSYARDGACLQCHAGKIASGDSSGHGGNCNICHHPHEGSNLPTGIPVADEIAEKILIVSSTGAAFDAPPNVPGFTPDSHAEHIANLCYDCHENATGGSASLPIGSDKILSRSDEHHPMGTNAILNTGGPGHHAPGYTTINVGASG